MLKFYFRTYFAPVAVILLLWFTFKPMIIDSLDNMGVITRRGKIVFSSNRDGNWDIFVMNPDGTNLRRLSRTEDIDELSPVWAPNGRRVAFVSIRDENSDIEIIGGNGGKRQRLTTNSAKDTDPAWSPDGEMIAFASYRDGHGEIYVINVDGSNRKNLTNHTADDYSPKWHPNGGKIFFKRKTMFGKKGSCYTEKICCVSPEGGYVSDVAEQMPRLGNIPSWSRKGNKIAFSGRVNVTQKQGVIYTLGLNNWFLKQITYRGDEEYDDNPTWSPDGKKIAFSRRVLYHRRPTDIYVVDLNCGEIDNLTDGIGDNDFPDWY